MIEATLNPTEAPAEPKAVRENGTRAARAPSPVGAVGAVRAEVLSVVAWAAEQPLACNAGLDPILTRAIDTPLGPMVAGACKDGLCLLEFADRRALPAESRELSRVLGRAIIAEHHSTPASTLASNLAAPTLSPHSPHSPAAPTAPAPFAESTLESAAPRNPLAVEHLDLAEQELGAYFAGVLSDFSVSLFMPGSPFERRVWTALQRIPYGETTSYGRLAFRLGTPGAARAVGRANGRNRIAIIVPCHRVIQEDGSLGGYGGGIDRKQKLLALERDGVRQGRLF